MKKIVLSFFLAVLYAADSLAVGDVAISRAIPVKNDSESVVERNENTVISRGARRTNTSEDKSTVSRSGTRSVPKSNENISNASSKSAGGVVSRSLNNIKTVSSRPTVEDGANTVGRNARVNAASINNTAAVRRAGLTLRTSTAEVGGRAMIIGTNKQTGSNIDEHVRSVQSRASFLSKNKMPKQQEVTAESLAQAKDVLERTADLNSTCQQQYNECMDQFCAVVDNNQKRCSCSASIARYAKVQKAVEDANTELNDVAQRIRYVGLSADEIRAIMSETEAEDALSKTKDNTENRSLLDKIASMIEDPESSSSSLLSSVDTSGILDMNMDFSSDSNEILGLGISLSGNSNDIAKKRGADLYREATKRCKSVLNSCKEAGGIESQITGNYDLAIDKDCIAYEQGLDKLNKTLVSNVRSANLMLQKARLAVLQNKNQYDIRGCVAALEKCMTDDMVCGEKYTKCIDPTKRYIDENGNVVLGENITTIIDYMKNYNSSIIDANFIRNTSGVTNCDQSDGACIVNYLMSKIGVGQSFKDGGLCRAVLDKCQDYTYVTNNSKTTYNPYNDVIVNYVQRAMVNIRAAQSQIISDYASSCLSDLTDCYNQQITNVNTLTSAANLDNVVKVMRGACYNMALTCGHAVFANDTSVTSDESAVEKISEVLNQSLLCPEHSVYQSSSVDISANRTIKGYVNGHCKCLAGYSVWDGSCLLQCASDEYRNNYGNCTKCSGGTLSGGTTNKTEHNSCSSI